MIKFSILKNKSKFQEISPISDNLSKSHQGLTKNSTQNSYLDIILRRHLLLNFLLIYSDHYLTLTLYVQNFLSQI